MQFSTDPWLAEFVEREWKRYSNQCLKVLGVRSAGHAVWNAIPAIQLLFPSADNPLTAQLRSPFVERMGCDIRECQKKQQRSWPKLA
jgi:hypothetical protein